MIRIGTSGFQYPEWKGKFYPEKLSAAKMLPFYAEKFSTTESNYTFRRMPTEKTLANWSAQTPENFRFALKAPQQITHFQKLVGSAETLEYFWKIAQTLGEKLGPILFQLPPFLKKDLARLEDFLAVIPKGMKAAFEFRDESWFDDEIFAALKFHNAALCIADSEKFSTPVVGTSDFGYFRLRDQYSKPELKKWAKIIAQESKRVEEIFVYFKHEETGSGPEFAKQLQKLLDV
ncbi:MAG: DUF72 domain-containing protein [Verrucomicrobiota bacterium]|nr:DUF72 domain-containing protein [Verrucomicrobiota bacterium]